MTLGPADLVLCSGTLRAETPLLERVEAASAAGFTGLSLWARDYQAARDAGWKDIDIRLLLADHGLSIAELDPVWWWLPGTEDVRIPPEHDPDRLFQFGPDEMFAMAEAVEARSLNVVDIFGGHWSLSDAAASFASLCRRASDYGLVVQLEFLPWSRIPDLQSAWRVVQEADQPNGGITVDSWHYVRSHSDTGLLRTLPGDRILGVQLSDGPLRAESDPIHATLHERRLPGDGAFDLHALLADLREINALAPLGIEVFSDDLRALSAAEVAQRAGAAMRAVAR